MQKTKRRAASMARGVCGNRGVPDGRCALWACVSLETIAEETAVVGGEEASRRDRVGG